MKLIIIIALLALITVFSVGSFYYGRLKEKVETASHPTPTSKTTNLNSDKLFALVNDYRAKINLAPLIKNEKLCVIARSRLPEIKKDWSHDLFHTHVKSGDYCYGCKLGENLARNYVTEQEVLSGWLLSPPHKKIIEEDYTNSCIETDDGYVVEIFGY